MEKKVSFEKDDDEKIEEGEIQCQPCLEGEEALDSVGLKTLYQPSREEIIEHERTHLPFRDWCEHCVRGRAKNDPHQESKDESTVSKVSWDYF